MFRLQPAVDSATQAQKMARNTTKPRILTMKPASSKASNAKRAFIYSRFDCTILNKTLTYGQLSDMSLL